MWDSKWLNDFKDDQKEDGAVHDNVPWTGWGGWGSPGWHDAYIKIAMVVYKYYEDADFIIVNAGSGVYSFELSSNTSKFLLTK